jgi:hypothetical protein
MKLRRADYFLARLAHAGRPVARVLGNVETEYLRGSLDSTPVIEPLFLTGLARSGTTILLQELCRTDLFATHRYRDFPFLMTPYVWNRFLDRFTKEDAPVERPHHDRIQITRESPEAFEEPIWQYFFPRVHRRDGLHRLGADESHPAFERFFREHIQKILLLRGSPRYLSKENYNIARLEYLAKMFPDAKFVLPVRHPFSHVQSLVRQHRLFTEYAGQDSRVAKYLALAGHYEFGPQRVPIRLTEEGGEQMDEAWRQGRDHVGYAIQWAQVYGFVHSLRSRGDALSKRIAVVRYEDFCSEPRGTLASILCHAGIKEIHMLEGMRLDHITPPRQDTSMPNLEEQAEIWQETADVARKFGYEPALHSAGVPSSSIRVSSAPAC